MITFIWITGIIVLIILSVYLLHFVPLRKAEDGFEYVHVEENGTVRELSRVETGYLKETFDSADGARPYIKSRYQSKTPDGKIHGYIQRNRVPKRIEIIEPKMNTETWRRTWILMIKDLTNLEYQKRTWLESNNTNPYYSFIEFMCSYFDDLNISNGYEKLIDNGLVTQVEFDSIAEWNNSLSEYDSPNNDDYDNKAVLNDPKWAEIIEIGITSIENLKPKLSKAERSLLI